jgi:hypothetical protein
MASIKVSSGALGIFVVRHQGTPDMCIEGQFSAQVWRIALALRGFRGEKMETSGAVRLTTHSISTHRILCAASET